jgi:hypothetical protein
MQPSNPVQGAVVNWLGDPELARLAKVLMQTGIDLREAGTLPTGPVSAVGPRADHTAFGLAGLADDVSGALKAERRGALAAEQREIAMTMIGHLRRYMTAFGQLDRVAQAAVCRELGKQVLAARPDLTAADPSVRFRARSGHDAAQWALDGFASGECAVHQLEAAVIAAICDKIMTEDGRTKPGPGKLATRMGADAVTICAVGFLGVIRSRGVLGGYIVSALLDNTQAGRAALRQVWDVLDRFWFCVTGASPDDDDKRHIALRNRFMDLVRSAHGEAVVQGMAAIKAAQAAVMPENSGDNAAPLPLGRLH